jgi:uncharacterized protein
MEAIEIGVIADTHGLLRPQAVEALEGVALIVHAGDVGKPAILDELRQIAPVFAVRGNVDTAPWAATLPGTTVVEVGEHLLYVLHDRADLDLNPAAAGFSAVIFGHSHQPQIEERQGVLYLNPGSAGPRRFRLPISVARLHIGQQKIAAEILNLAVK